MARLSTGSRRAPTFNTAAEATATARRNPAGTVLRCFLSGAAFAMSSLAGGASGVAGERVASTPEFVVAQGSAPRKVTMKIRMTINGKVATASLDDTPAARDFASLLPLSITLTDYASTEKVSDLPKRLSQEGAPAGYEPSVGDITYYAPWGNLAIFYRGFSYSRGLIRLGKIETGVEALNQSGSLKTTIEVVGP